VSWVPELPLLRRELTELANRRRTYIVRVVGAIVILFFVFIAYNQEISGRMGRPITATTDLSARFLGIGGDVFRRITPTLFFAIQLLIPALCCAAVTSEKESNTFGTLLLTRLSPGVIVVEKFLSRLVPMLTLLALTFPVLAHVHALGGVDTNQLVGTLWLLFAECLLFASISILCSSWFATTVSAFTVSYFVTGLLAILSLSLDFETFVPSAIWRTAQHARTVPPSSQLGLTFHLILSSLGLANSAGPTPGWILVFVSSIPALLTTIACLLVARLVLVRRAFITHASILMKFFRAVDVFFKDINDRTTGGIMIISDSTSMPLYQPVVWREQNKKSLGKLRYLIRILVAIEFPTLLICAYAAIGSARSGFDGLYILQVVVWIMAAVVAMVKGSTLFTSERANQTLEPLLATPMTTVEILDQKIAGMRRLLVVLAVPVLTVNFTHAILSINFSGAEILSVSTARGLVYLFLSVCCCFVMFRLIAWSSLGIGLRVHSQTKAVLISFGFWGVWSALPFVVTSLMHPHPETGIFMAMFSPVTVPLSVESLMIYGIRSNEDFPIHWWAVASLIVYGLVSIAVQHFVRSSASKFLQRRDGSWKQSLRLLNDTTHQPTLEGGSVDPA